MWIKKQSPIVVTLDSGLRSILVSALHPLKKQGPIVVTLDSGLRSILVSALHPLKKA